jgi:hypothetical protein
MRSKAEFIVRGFKELEVGLNPTSRLGKQIDVYLDRKGILPQVIEPDHPLFQTAVEAQRDLNQVAFALTQLMPIVPRSELNKRLRKLVEDNVLPQDSPDRSPGRDAQCELFVGALCARAQLEPVFDESPDLRCRICDQTFGVAVKRIKAPPERFDERFKQRMREAAEQIGTSGVPGVIVTDISQSLNSTNWRVPLEFSDPGFDSAWTANMSRVTARFAAPLIDWTRGKNVRGVILLNHILRYTPTQVWRMELLGASIPLSPSNQRRRREFELFDTKFQQALCNPGDFSRGVS